MDIKSAYGGLGDAVAIEGTTVASGDESSVVEVVDIATFWAFSIPHGVDGKASRGPVACGTSQVVSIDGRFAVAEVGLPNDKPAKAEGERTHLHFGEGDFSGFLQGRIIDGTGGAARLFTYGDELPHAVDRVVGDVGDIA